MGNNFFLGLVKGVGQTLQEQHAEDVILVFRRVHVAAQDIGGFPQEGFKLLQADLLGGGSLTHLAVFHVWQRP